MSTLDPRTKVKYPSKEESNTEMPAPLMNKNPFIQNIGNLSHCQAQGIQMEIRCYSLDVICSSRVCDANKPLFFISRPSQVLCYSNKILINM
jgi:hypothetical protein